MNFVDVIFCFLGWEQVIGALTGLVSLFSALLTPVIGAIALYIAYQQHVTNKRQLRLALFDRRRKVFNAVGELIGRILRQGRIDNDDLAIFQLETRENEFLFGSDIAAYLNELYVKASDVHALDGATDEVPRNQRVEALLWFRGQMQEAKTKFGRYMSFPEAF